MSKSPYNPRIYAPSTAVEPLPSATGHAQVDVVDDDHVLRASLNALLASIGLGVREFGTARDMLKAPDTGATNCFVLDVRLPDKNGLELRDDLERAGIRAPIIFISGYADVRLAVRAMKSGAADFLAKPFHEQELLDAVQSAIERDRGRRQRDRLANVFAERFASLTGREQQVMAHVVGGRRNKEIAASLGVSEITVKAHRTQVMKKMSANSVPELIGMGQLLGHAEAQPEALLRRQPDL